ncbi:MAG: hypothetical protein AAF845_11420 [Bacteroidota bacterium]
MTPRLLAGVLLLGAAGCASDPEPATPPDRPATPTEAPAPEAEPDTTTAPDTASTARIPEVARPATRTDSFLVEGMPEPIDLRLVEVADVPLPFSTYLPEGWTDEVTASGEGTAVQFTMAEAASLSLFVPATATTEAEVVDLARAVADARGGAEAFDTDDPWVRAAFRFIGDTEVGTVRVGAHDGTFFSVTEAYPAEFGDGFAPRARLVLDHLRWADESGL